MKEIIAEKMGVQLPKVQSSYPILLIFTFRTNINAEKNRFFSAQREFAKNNKVAKGERETPF